MRKIIAKILMGSALCALLLAAVCSLVYADDTADFTEMNAPAGKSPEGTQPITTSKGFHGLVGAGVFAGENIAGHRHVAVFPIPFVSIKYSDWAYLHLTRAGVWVLQSPERSLKLGVSLGYRQGWYENDDDSLLRGMADRRSSLDGSVDAVWHNPIVTISVSYFHDLLGVSDGDGASIRFSHAFRLGGKFVVIAFAGAEWRSNRLNNYYYGVRPEEATASRPEYHAGDSVDLRLGLGAGYRLSESWFIMASAHARRLGDGIAKSPIVLDRYGAYSFVGVGWRF